MVIHVFSSTMFAMSLSLDQIREAASRLMDAVEAFSQGTFQPDREKDELVRQSLAWTCFVETPRAEPAPVVPQEGEASGVGSSEGALLLTFRPGPSQR